MKADIYFSRQFACISTDEKNGITSGSKKSIPLTEGMSLYYALQQEGIVLAAPCGGNGTCGACKIRLLHGELEETDKDIKHLSETERQEGWRLACQAYPKTDCAIYAPSEQFQVLTAYGENEAESDDILGKNGLQEELYNKEHFENNKNSDEKNMLCKIAIDLGTTTMAYELFDSETGKTIRTISATNPQRLYGADVVSRIEQSNNGRRDLLKNILRQQMKKDIKILIGESKIASIQSITISANTAMVHLFMGYSCEGLGRYPFIPQTLECIHTNASEVSLMDERIPVCITGGISAYVGGDILVGLGSLNILSGNKVTLFIDLGTNAEMVLFDGREKLFVTSAPAGPAFEAANISCGVGSVEGAISEICIEKENVQFKTIGDKVPVGFCGSGILESIYELKKNDLIDTSGLLCEPYFETGYPVGNIKITQQDIRQIQLAKSAVFSAIQILLLKAGLVTEQIEQVYLAGGFGYHLNVEKAIGIGLLPAEFKGKVKTVGNSSLQGSKDFALGRTLEKHLREIVAVSEEVYLSNETGFQEMYIKNMEF